MSTSKLVLPNSANSFYLKENYEATQNLVNIRSQSFKIKEKVPDESDVWKRRPVDFTWRLYQPQPPKRNSKEAMKPWKYGKFSPTRSIEKEPSADEYIRSLSKEFNISRLTDRDKSDFDEKSESDFQTRFRVLTPNSARVDAAKTMSYRDGLDQYKIPKSYDHRPLEPVKTLGLPEFKTRLDSDPFNIKHLSENLRTIHGSPELLRFPNPYDGVQMGDNVLKQGSKYLPNLILPRLPYPNQFYGYTRYRKQNRSVESAYWDRMLEKINEKWMHEKAAKEMME